MSECENKYENAAEGLRMMYLIIRNMLIACVPTVVLVLFRPSLFPICAFFVALLFLALECIAEFKVAEDIPLCEVAFWMQIWGSVTIILPLIALFVWIVGVKMAVKEKGATSAVKWGNLTFGFTIVSEICLVIAVVLAIILFLFKVDWVIILILSLVIISPCIPTLIFFMLFLKRSAEALGAY